MTERHVVCPASELQPGERQLIEVRGLPHEIGVFNVGGEFYALANVCPHQLAPLCKGPITGEVTADEVGDYDVRRTGEVIRCPWHGWKFNITDGTSVFNPHAVRTRSYQATVETACGSTDEECVEYSTDLAGDEPPVETYDVGVEEEVVVVYV